MDPPFFHPNPHESPKPQFIILYQFDYNQIYLTGDYITIIITEPVYYSLFAIITTFEGSCS